MAANCTTRKIEMDSHLPNVGFSTAAIHSGQDPERWQSRAVVPPIVTATTFKQSSPYGEHQEFVYGRSGNPTRKSLEECLAAVEGAKYALTFASGLGAVSAIVSLISAGDHLLTSDDVYGGTTRLFRNVVARMGIEITYIDFTNLDDVRKSLKTNTKMIWLESPTNPLMKVVDIAAVVKIARKQPNIIIVADNTFLTPYFQKPLDLGVDISMYSVTKYLNGHADVIMGSVALNDADLAKRLSFLQNSIGVVASPYDCYLVNRSLKTLALRMDRHRTNSLAVAEWLTKQPCVVEVMHPELPTHPQLAITKKQTTGHSGVFSFRHCGGQKETSIFLSSLQVFTLAESLGGYESLAALPCTMSHGSLPEDLKKELGITDSLIRLSIGLEDVKDLIADMEQALNKAFKTARCSKL
ncbi:cys/Met metabolism PLP-dependent enzyme domain-containing protein [Phthorimaea operculella]|nr:cys/Met metabolism PLP-dependent enzyme domain-containing protein [Phthorimaea operculella]